MNLFSALSEAEGKAIWDQVWEEEFARVRRDYSFYRYVFRAFLLSGEKDLEKRGLLEFFRKTKRLPDYPRAEGAIKRGCANWAQQEFRIGPSEEKDYQAMHKAFLLWGLRSDPTLAARQERIRLSSKLVEYTKAGGDKEFFRKLRHDRAEPPRKREGYREFIQALLANWLTSFWWLMPLKAVAEDHDKADKSAAFDDFYQNLRQITTRRVPPSPGAFYSAGWNGVFYRSQPPLIKRINPDGSIEFTGAGLGSRELA